MSYSPPTGASVTLVFGSSLYTSPSGASVTLEFDAPAGATIYPPAIFDDGYGTARAWLGQQWVYPTGITSTVAFGTAFVDYKRIFPDGIASAEAFGTSFVWLGQQWALPESIVVEMQAGHVVYRDDFYSAPANAPDGSALSLEFGSLLYTAPTASFVVLEFEPAAAATIYPQGIDESALGDATVENFLTYAAPSGIAAGAVGSHTVTTPPVLLPTGIAQWKLGFSGDGTGLIDFARRALAPASISASALGTTRVDSSIRNIDLAGRGIAGTSIGTQFIAYKERFVYPSYIFANAFGMATMGFDRNLEPAGIDAGAFGVQDVHDNTQTISSIASIHDHSVEIPEVTRSPRIIAPPGFDLREIAPSERWGHPDLYNLTQILPRVAIDPDPENGGVFGEPNNTLVENRNRTIAHFGHRDSTVSGLATIENTGRALVVTGLDATLFGSHLIAPAIRTYELEGIDSPWFTPYHAVYNAAFQALPAGIDQSAVGAPAWANPPQDVRFTGAFDSQAHGTPFVAFAIRFIAPPLGPEAFFGQDHKLELAMRYITPHGLDATRWGATYVYEHFNIAAAHSILPPAMPLEHYVRNVTPQIYPYAYDMTEWGRPEARYNPYPIASDGFVASGYGNAVIRDRTQTAATPGMGAGQLGQFAQVRNDSPDPPSNRSVSLAGFIGSAYGTTILRINEVTNATLGVQTAFGSHEARLIGARVPSISPPENQVPTQAVRGPRTVTLDATADAGRGIKAPDDPLSSFAPTKHDLSPRTIWATFDVTAQANLNHPGEWVLMDDHLDTVEPKGMRPFFGRPEISNQFRGIVVGSVQGPLEIVSPVAESTIRTIYPQGKLMQRFGLPSLPGEQILDHSFGGFVDGAIGQPTVENFDKDVMPLGLAPPGVAGHDVSHFHREIIGVTAGAGTIGAPRVHPPEPIIPGMGAQTLYGAAMVDFRIRNVHPTGWDSLAHGEEVGGFGNRMRVTKRYPIRPSGIGEGDIGAHRVSDAVQHAQHVALPGPGKPPAPDVRINNIIALGGMGEWFGGYGETVITHADNMDFVCGESSRAIPATIGDHSAVGSHGVAHG